jgi:hypothetical protein
MLRPGPAPGLAELADDMVIVAVREDARLVRLTIDDVIDHDGQVFIRSGDRAAASRPSHRAFPPLPPAPAIRATSVDDAARLPIGLILRRNLASTLGYATNGSAPAC